ncbi:hypothetical protein [Paenibacillus castaneae]|uniref:hypothetical protein n=1 Tax=Paenibacillus castaneae TaxID=474957 RepID=UPI000C9A17DB|nr:hypothetical protein [Paenibacillus castaneae]
MAVLNLSIIVCGGAAGTSSCLLPIPIPLINKSVYVIKLRKTRRTVEIIQLWLIEDLRPYFMHAAMQIRLYKASKLIQVSEGARIKLHPLFSSSIIAIGAPDAIWNLAPRCN